MNYITEIEKLVPIPIALKGTANDYEPMRQIIEDAGMNVVKNVEKFNRQDLTLFTNKFPVTASGVVNETSIVDFVERDNKTCIEIEAGMKNMAIDASSLNYATKEYPVFYKENGRIYVLPEPEEGTGNSFESSQCLFSKYLTSDNYGVVKVTFISNNYDFANSDISSTLASARVSHNLQTGDYLQIKQIEDYPLSTHFQTSQPIYVKRIDAYSIVLQHINWSDTFQGTIDNSLANPSSYPGVQQIASSMSGANETYYTYIGYRPKYSSSIAHIVKSVSTRGDFVGDPANSDEIYYNSESGTIATPVTWSAQTSNDQDSSE